jgi:GAF domain-containing protein
VRAEGIGALAFIPLKEDGRLIGKFMAYHDSPHVFAQSEVHAGLAIARQLAFALERRRAAEATQRRRRGSLRSWNRRMTPSLAKISTA